MRPLSVSVVPTAVLLVLTASSCRPPDEEPPAPEVLTCTPAPAPPKGAPSDWAAAVHSNCFDDLQRLGRWKGGIKALKAGESPESSFESVAAGSISGTGVELVVLAHGWAPGFRQAVDRAGGKLRWWTTDATDSLGVYASDWAWIPTAVTTPPVSVCVSQTGFFQQLRAHFDKTGVTDGVVLGFSWIDGSATGGSFLDLVEVYRSEAYTNISGIRLANALEAALAPGFWADTSNRLHLIGHSHGSKVATVAALTLQQRGKRVDHLTILDSPESHLTLEGNGANLLGFYLDQMEIADPAGGGSGAFVDNTPSFFGVSYAGLDNIVEVNLEPGAIYYLHPKTDPGNKHSYSAVWYSGAAAAVSALGLSTPLGLDWPPPPATFRPALNQSFTAASGLSDPCSSPAGLDKPQWELTAGPPRLGSFGFSTTPAPIEVTETTNVTCSPSSCDKPESLTFQPGPKSAPAIFRGGYSNPPFSDGYGLGFDVTWTGATAGDYLVVTVDSPEEGEFGVQEVILVMDGRSQPDGTYPVAFNATISSFIEDIGFAIYLVPASGSGVEVTTANFRRVLISGVPWTDADVASEPSSADR